MSLLHRTVNRVFCILTLIFCLWSCPFPVFSLTLQEEEELAKDFVRYITATHRLVRDPFITDYVRDVGRRVVDTLENPPFPMTFDVVIAPSYNAFAGPGGHIYIHSGLLMAMEDESELAGILAHEIAHVSCRHIPELVERSRKAGMGALAGVAAGILAALGGASPDAALGLIVGSQAAGQSAMLSYTRDNERQADERGLDYLTRAGYGGEGLLHMLRKIRGQEWYSSDDVPVYLRTHPGTEERVAFVASWLESRKKTLTRTPEADPSDRERFHRVRMRLQGRYGDVERSLQDLRQILARNPEEDTARHALALVLIRRGDGDAALEAMEAVARKSPMDPLVMADLGRIRYRVGQLESAIVLLESMAPETGDPEVFFDLGQALASQGRDRDAVRVFNQTMEMAPELVGARYAAGQALGRLGEEGLAHYHLGRYHEALRDYVNADFHYGRCLILLSEETAERQDAGKRREEMRREIRKKAAEKGS